LRDSAAPAAARPDVGRQFRALGLVEVLGAIGLILPAALGVTPILMALAALGSRWRCSSRSSCSKCCPP
jgi:hypothetical protein